MHRLGQSLRLFREATPKPPEGGQN
jgi:hypothetical protein